MTAKCSYDVNVTAYTLGYDAGYIGDSGNIYLYISHPSTREIDEFDLGYRNGQDAAEEDDMPTFNEYADAYLRAVATYN